MEIRNTATEAELEWLDTQELIVRLMRRLREVAVHESYLPSPSDRMVESIQLVQRIHSILQSRKTEPLTELRELTTQTGWLMDLLLEDCLKWPEIMPRVREQDGILRFQRCGMCHKREYPTGGMMRACNQCLSELMDMLASRTPPPGVIFFRTYNDSHRCPHADSETVLMTWDDEYFLGDGRCIQCLREEYNERQTRKR